ncbi:MAG TPA: tetratricopeptide repeat protein, partial [Planctomycetota bacterium]|nr:tetratricopeptide repeat protein [Planctomycetota bacterium]
MLRLTQRREKVQSQLEFVRLLAETRVALETYLKDHPQAPDTGRAMFHVAETYLWSADYPSALAKLRSVLEAYPDGEDAPTAAFLIGQVLLREDDLSKARSALEDFVRRYPKDDRVLLARSLIAVTYQNEQKYDEA